jgi:hypothetical protein
MVRTKRVNSRRPAWSLGGRGAWRVTLWWAGVVAGGLLVGAPSLASAAELASTYDAPGQRHNDQCVNLSSGLSSLDLRYLSGFATGFQLSNALTFTSSGGCQTGQIRLDVHEVVRVPSNPDPAVKQGLVFHRGGNGYVDADNVKYGQVAVSQLNGKLPKPVPSGGGRGQPCQTLQATPYKVSVQPIPPEMKYKSPAQTGGNNAGASYLHYGDPASQQGDRHDIHYSTLTWSWIDVAGGGHNRILLAPDQQVRLCDVQEIRRDSWAPSSIAPDGQVNGWVIARYVQTRVANGPALYGWMVWQHHYNPDGTNPDGSPVVVNHFSPL